MQLLLVEYRWSDMPRGEWRFMFVADNMESVDEHLQEYVFNSSDWSARWGNGYETYTKRRLASGRIQTVRICKTTLVTPAKQVAA